MVSEVNLKKEIVRFSQKLTQNGYVANHDGNISVKVGSHLWLTPSATNKGDVTQNMLVMTDLSGKKISGNHSVFSEIDLHLAAYQLRSDIGAVVHAHPPIATSFAVSGVSLQKVFIAEAIVTLGDEIPLVPFIPAGCQGTLKTLSPFLSHYDVLLLQSHGVLAVGKTLEQAYYRLELVEHLAKIEWYSRSLGNPKSLSSYDVEQLLQKRASQGLARPKPPPSGGVSVEKIVEEEVRRLLQKNSNIG